MFLPILQYCYQFGGLRLWLGNNQKLSSKISAKGILGVFNNPINVSVLSSATFFAFTLRLLLGQLFRLPWHGWLSLLSVLLNQLLLSSLMFDKFPPSSLLGDLFIFQLMLSCWFHFIPLLLVSFLLTPLLDDRQSLWSFFWNGHYGDTII